MESYRNQVFRNFASLAPSQNLVDDLVTDPTDQQVLNGFFYSDGQTSLTKVERVYQKSVSQILQEEIASKFCPQNWYASRYSDGTWGVLYTAESEEVAFCEALYHLRENFYREELLAGAQLELHRRVVALTVEAQRMEDITRHAELNVKCLLSQDVSGYPYCQTLAEKALEQGAQMLKTPSARKAGGICTPIFDPTVVAQDGGHLKYQILFLSWQECRLLSEENRITFF